MKNYCSSNGMLGTYVSKILTNNNINIIGLTRKDYDLSKEIQIKNFKKIT